MLWAKTQWNSNYESNPLFLSNDSSCLETELGFRLSYGLFNNFEIGMYIPVNTSCIGTGFKYNFFNKEKISLAGISGINIHTGNNTYNTKIDYSDKTTSINGGIALSYVFSDKLSIDINGQIHKHIRKTLDNHLYDTFISSDIGYYIIEGLQLVASINYSNEIYNHNTQNTELLMLNTGITIETADNFILVLNTPIHIIGKNNLMAKGFGMALTICID